VSPRRRLLCCCPLCRHSCHLSDREHRDAGTRHRGAPWITDRIRLVGRSSATYFLWMKGIVTLTKHAVPLRHCLVPVLARFQVQSLDNSFGCTRPGGSNEAIPERGVPAGSLPLVCIQLPFVQLCYGTTLAYHHKLPEVTPFCVFYRIAGLYGGWGNSTLTRGRPPAAVGGQAVRERPSPACSQQITGGRRWLLGPREPLTTHQNERLSGKKQRQLNRTSTLRLHNYIVQWKQTV
jgi:hypothetical protein